MGVSLAMRCKSRHSVCLSVGDNGRAGSDNHQPCAALVAAISERKITKESDLFETEVNCYSAATLPAKVLLLPV